MQAYKINGLLVKVERCAADMYIVRNIPGVFDNQVAIGAIVHKELAQKFLDVYKRQGHICWLFLNGYDQLQRRCLLQHSLE